VVPHGLAMKFTARNIATLTLPEGQDDRVVFDEDLPGFGYRLRARDGRVQKTFIFRYRNATGRTRKYLIGPGVMPITAARDRAMELLVQVKRGDDPQGDKAAARERQVLAFGRVADDFIADRQPSWRKSTIGHHRHILLIQCKPLHTKAIDEITRAELASVIKHVEQNIGLCSAAEARKCLSALFTWAMREGRIEKNPVLGTREVAYNVRRTRVLNDEELARVWRAASEPFAHSCKFGHVLRLLLLTGCRRQEVIGMRWCELDDRGNWTIPEERSKNKRAHTLPLPPPALAIIEEMRPYRDEREYVFSKKGKLNPVHALLIVQERCGFADWWVHDLRRTVVTGMNRIGILPHVVECVVNHVSGFRAGVAAVYNHNSYEREMAQALQRWSEHVLALAEGRADKVVPLRAS
jgi:integrase